MQHFPKVLESTTKVRFQDCDPLNHLNNSKYFDYMINAREDQLIEHYDLDIFENAKITGTTWVVVSHQIAYIRPALVMESLTISSQLVQFNKKQLWVEILMYNKEKTVLKAVLWSSFIHFNISKGKAQEHDENFMKLFSDAVLPIKEKTFEDRVQNLRKIIL